MRRIALAIMLAGTVLTGVGCFNTNIFLDHYWIDNPTSGPGGTSQTSIHTYDSDYVGSEPCTYPTDFGCHPGNTRPVPQPVAPNGDNFRKGREGPFTTLTAADTPCTHQDANDQPGHGWIGYGGFTPPSDNCIAYMQAEITDDPSDSNPDEPMWNICARLPESGTPPTTASGANPRDCQNGGTGVKATGGGPTNINTWARAQFVGSNPSQGWTNTKDFIMEIRDYYTRMITDSQLSGFQANGYATCWSLYDYTPSSGGSSRVRLQRLCP